MPWGFSALMGGARFSQNSHLQRKAAAKYSRELCFQCLSLTTSHIHPCFPRRSPRTAVRFDPDSYGDFALPWDPVHVKFCVHLLRMGSPFPPVLWSSCLQAPLAFNATGLQCQMLQEFFLPVPDPHTLEFDLGLRTLNPISESL